MLRKLFQTAIMLAPAMASAEQACLPHGDLVALMSETYQASQVAIGKVGAGSMMEVFVAQDGQFALVVTTADRNACVVATGAGWMMVNPAEVYQ